ncbi:MAG: RecQ family ATP-dependent DNA helicase [Prevotella sp.]|nr:RecQ family ATP-dependent DNA helicase [Prevotella sp.]
MIDYTSILRHYWGYPDFRGIQREIIESIGAGKDTLGLMPTGGGKSITFQVPAMAQDGVCVVITPLIALMKDQVAHLRKIGILAAAIYGSMRHDEILATLENCVYGGVKILYVSPERLGSELFQTKLKHMRVSFITVDEAHCISQWGYDFRPSYLKIADIRKIKPGVPILALTATATPIVIDDIQERLQFREKNVFRMSYARKNLAYIVRTATDKEQQMLHILQSVPGSAIVYVHSRRRTKEIADYLLKEDIPALSYHAGLDSVVRDERQREWHDNRVRVMVATNAFGMGIDKPDVRLVIHMDCPDSLEAYFQEAGRAGRDGQKSYAVMLYNDSDERKLKKRISENYPEKEAIRKVYEHLAYFYQIAEGSGSGASYEFNIDKFCHTFRHFPIQVDSSLKILMRSGYIDYSEEKENKARVHFLIDRNDFYRLESLTPNENQVITALLRNYGGLFSDYGYIDESFVAQQAGLQTQQQVYMILKNLSDKHILHFIPQRKTPVITYTQRREDPERVIIPPEVYEQRKEQFAQRIASVINYAKNQKVCRSRMLLDYFGESNSEDCGQCDVCLHHRKDYLAEEQIEKARKSILSLLADGRQHWIHELNKLPLSSDLIDTALQNLVDEEQIQLEGSRIHI